ncbi:MAG: hypothetical protein KGZ42_07275 [Melioribacter sp.]|nr:hypothetical protein [Melioribacter sp.]
MKRIILVTSIIVVLTSCKNLEAPKTVDIYLYDFTKYAEKGFLFTPETYNYEYESMGMIYVQIYPEIKRKGEDKYMGDPEKNYVIGKIDVSEAIEQLFQSAKKIGANAIIRFQINSISKQNSSLLIEGIEASGFAIKRK